MPNEKQDPLPTASRPLPAHDSPEIAELFTSREVEEAARFLLSRVDNPPTMVEWRKRSREVFGKEHSQSDRRLRQVRDVFDVLTERTSSGQQVYRVVSWRTAPPPAAKVSPRIEAEVYNLKGRFCAMCGRGPADGVVLQIDHIIPSSWGGPSTLDNLEPLCQAHNHGKSDFFSSFDSYGAEIRACISLPTVWERIGELWKILGEKNIHLPANLLPIIATDSHQGDPARRLRDLHVVLGWKYKVHKTKTGRRTLVTYELLEWKPWPKGGAHEAVRRYEKARKARVAAARAKPADI